MKYAVFGGTTEGRELCEYLKNGNKDFSVFTATAEGAEMLSEDMDVKSGRLDEKKMEKVLSDFDIIIDATHPYATEATRNICAAAAAVGVEYHRLLRPDAFEPYGLLTQPERRNDCPDPVKWKQPDDMKPAGDHVVRWSEVDWNGHLNNTIYANYLCDYLPGGMKGKRITGFSIAFVKEAVEGETLHMTAAEREGEAFVTGAHDRGVCFDARLSFVPKP